ncbi:MAG: hypothetical protein ACOC56_05770 [Atribacterota bacterium]
MNVGKALNINLYIILILLTLAITLFLSVVGFAFSDFKFLESPLFEIYLYIYLSYFVIFPFIVLSAFILSILNLVNKINKNKSIVTLVLSIIFFIIYGILFIIASFQGAMDNKDSYQLEYDCIEYCSSNDHYKYHYNSLTHVCECYDKKGNIVESTSDFSKNQYG